MDPAKAVGSVGMNCAVSECEPSASTDITEADPETSGWVVPTWVAPSKNFTVPAAALGVTVAFNVSVAPCAAGDVGVTPSTVVVGVPTGAFTVYGTAVDVDPAKAVGSVGMNCAVSECAPSASTDVTCAIPETTGWVVPTWVAPSKNFTVPAAALGVTVAFNVSVAPCAAGDAGVTPSTVVVVTGPAGFTVYGTAVDVDPANAVGSVGMNCAVSECAPSASTDVTCAIPETTGWVVPTWVAPSKNFTVPAAAVGVTEAFNVSVAPCAAGDTGVTPSTVVVEVATAGKICCQVPAVVLTRRSLSQYFGVVDTPPGPVAKIRSW